ncbi:predicted protein [Naegleria gruberi]|uniref:Predicted protein n=1 Tax=Naegleria gruberi TaxID=5762 RepID=D2VVL9_NAEGR|nr:uncharacterized protein NAEGRDRAFT_73065 [Naegleria gruberi]EFC39062.1 predicted protein [Naegleria gruberi]|eukprot:XP_002671806.1 predicted protein [Naegleria gruberi strain NEG-M]
MLAGTSSSSNAANLFPVGHSSSSGHVVVGGGGVLSSSSASASMVVGTTTTNSTTTSGVANNMKPCYYTFFSDDCTSPLQQQPSKSKFPSSPNSSGSGGSVPHFISKQEKERLKLNAKKTVSLAFIGMGNHKAIDITNQVLKKQVFYDKTKTNTVPNNQPTNTSTKSTSENSGFVILNNVVNSNISDQQGSTPRKQHQISIDSYHDVDQNKVYLFADLMQTPEHCKTFTEQFLPYKMSTVGQTNSGYQNILTPNTNHSFDLEHAIDFERVLQTLLFLFQTSHMIFFILPSSQNSGSVCSSLHQNLLSLFRVLQISKQYVNSKVLDVIHQEKSQTTPTNPTNENPTMKMINTILTSPVMLSLYSPGRVLPVISFIFVQERENWNKMASLCEQQKLNVDDELDEYMLNRMQNGVENQVRNHILKKGKFSGVDSIKTPLFMMDPNTCTFVIVEPEDSEISPFGTKVSLEHSRKALFSLSDISDSEALQKSSINSRAHHKSKKPSDSAQSRETYIGVNKIAGFIQKQLDYFTKQMQAGKRFILPTSLNWYQATFAFEELFSLNNEELQKILVDKTKDIIHPNFSFSDKRCSHAFKIATDHFLQKVQASQSTNAKMIELVNETISKYKTFACGYFSSHYNQQLQTFLQANTPKPSQTQPQKFVPYQFVTGCPISQISIQKIGDYTSMNGRNGAIRRGNQIINFIQVHTMLSRDRYQKRKKKKPTNNQEYAQDTEGNDTFLIAFEYETPRKEYVLNLDQLTQLFKQTHPTEGLVSALDMIQKTSIPLFLPSNWFLSDKKGSFARLKQITIGIPDADLTNTITFSPKISVPVKQEGPTPATTIVAPKIFPLCNIKQGIVFGRNQFLTIDIDYDSNQLNNYEDVTQLFLYSNSIQIN